MHLTAAQYRACSLSGPMKRQLVRVVDNPHTRRWYGQSSYRHQSRGPKELWSFAYTPELLIEAWRNTDNLILCRLRSSLDPRQQGSIKFRACDKTVHVHSAICFLGMKRHHTWHFMQMEDYDCAWASDHEELTVTGRAHPRGDHIDHPFALLESAPHDNHARLELAPFRRMPTLNAHRIIHGAQYYFLARPDGEKTISSIAMIAAQFGLCFSYIGGAAKLITHFNLGPLSTVAIYGIPMATHLTQKTIRTIRNQRREAHEPARVDSHLWALMHTNPQLRAEPLIVEAATASLTGVDDDTIRRSLQRMAKHRYIESRERQVITAEGHIVEVPHYDLRFRPPRGNDPDKRRRSLRDLIPRPAFERA